MEYKDEDRGDWRQRPHRIRSSLRRCERATKPWRRRRTRASTPSPAKGWPRRWPAHRSWSTWPTRRRSRSRPVWSSSRPRGESARRRGGRRRGHHVALSVVGTERSRKRLLPRQDGARKADQGRRDSLHDRSRDAVLRVRGAIAQSGTDGQTVPCPRSYMQPIAAADVAVRPADIALGAPLNGTIEVAGPERARRFERPGRAIPDGDARIPDKWSQTTRRPLFRWN